MDKVETKETKVSEISDFGRLSGNLDSLRDTLGTFEQEVSQLHSEVFKEPMSEKESKPEAEEEPKNKVIELLDKVEVCFKIQRKIADKFDDFKNLLY